MRGPDATRWPQFETESYFFPGSYDSSMALSNASALTEINGTGVCVDRGAGVPADFCISVAQVDGHSLGVRVYCVPQVPGGSVYLVSGAGFGPFTLPGDIMDVEFVDPAGSTLALLLRINDADAVYLMTGAGLQPLPSVAPLVPKSQALVRVVSMWAVEGGLILDAVVRGFDGTAMVGSMLNFRYELRGNRSRWAPSSIDLSPYAGQYWFTGLPDGEYLLIPRIDGYPVYSVEFLYRGGVLQSNGLVPLQDLSRVPFAGKLANMVVAAKSLHTSWVFAASQNGWDWLLQLRLEGTFTNVYSSTPVTARMSQQGHCDAISCEGCSDLATNRLCQAYNKCALMNCVGTPVNLRRPLCGIGGVLRAYTTLGVQSFRGGWTMFVELLSLVISLSAQTSSGANIAFPEDEFMGYMCTAKNAFANSWAVITSALNSALYLGHANVGFMYHGASNVDTNADAMLTITMKAVTVFLNQLSLLPLYGMLATHQIYICQASARVRLACCCPN